MKRLVLLLLLSATSCETLACTAPVTVITPQGKIAYTADQIVVRVNELQNAAIQANTTNGLDTNSTRTIVQFCLAANGLLRSTPSGWQQTLQVAWMDAKVKLAGVKNQTVLTAMSLVDAVLLGVQ